MKRTLSLLLWTLLAAPAFAEEPTSSPVQVKPSLFVEGYQTFNVTNSSLQSGETNPGLQYNSQDGLPSIGLVEAGLTATQGEGEAYVSFLFGPGAEYLFGTLPPSDLFLWEAHVTYRPGDWAFTFGRRVTHMGYESVRTDRNWNLSKSILFQSAPTLHTGLSASCSPQESFSVTGYYYGGWDGLQDLSPSFQGKALGLKVDWSPMESLDLTLGALTGAVPFGNPGDLAGQSLFEIYAVLQAAEGLEFALHAEYGSLKDPLSGDQWPYGGAALYGRLEIAAGWAVALRLEGFLDETNMLELYDVDSIVPQLEAREATLTLERKLTENLLARLEGRFDQVLSEGLPVPAFAGGLASEQFTVTAAVMFGL